MLGTPRFTVIGNGAERQQAPRPVQRLQLPESGEHLAHLVVGRVSHGCT
jgi:hypothetical protein